MANINTIETESIQVGTAGLPAFAAVDVWPSLNPTVPFSMQNWGISNFQGLHNQIGLYNGIGVQNQLGADTCIGFGIDIGGACDAQPSYDTSAINVDINSPSGNLGGTWTYNGVPICASFLCSDIDLKKNIKPLENSLDKVLKLQGVSFDWKKELIPVLVSQEGENQIGLVAQEVEKILPELVIDTNIEGNQSKAIKYQNLTALLVEAIKEQQEQINSLKETVQELSTKLAQCCS